MCYFAGQKATYRQVPRSRAILVYRSVDISTVHGRRCGYSPYYQTTWFWRKPIKASGRIRGGAAGFYCLKSAQRVRNGNFGGSVVVGVRIWGLVAEYKNGFRAEWAMWVGKARSV